MSQLNIEKDFLSNVDYLNALVKKVNGVSTSNFDSNLVYEIHYADLYLSNIIPQITDSDLLKQVNDIKSAFEFILCSVPYDKLNESVSKDDYITLIKTKYKDIDLGSYTKDVAYSTGESSIGFYFKNKLTSVVCAFLLPLLVISGVLPKLTSFILELFDSFLGSEGAVDAATVTQNVQASSEIVNSMSNITTLLLNLIVMLVIMITTLGIVVDLMYISLPFMRMMLADKSANLISEQARLAVEMTETNPGVGYKKVKSFDRIKRNEAWLSSMLKTLEPIKDRSRFSILYQKLDNLKKDIDSHDFGLLSDRKHLYFQYAKIEFLHNEFLSLMKDYSAEGV